MVQIPQHEDRNTNIAFRNNSNDDSLAHASDIMDEMAAV